MQELPTIFGIVNITPDSFSDGGLFLEPQAACNHAATLMEAGADVLDLGAASSHPDAKEVSAEQELYRLAPVLEILLKKGWPLSIDTHRIEIQRYVISKGIAFLNDIHGFPIPSFYPELAQSTCQLIVMHSIQRHHQTQAIRQVTDPKVLYQQIIEFFENKISALLKAGIASERIILDPGMGFFLGSNPESSVYVLRKLGELKQHFNLPLMVSVSRKSFLGKLSQSAVTERSTASLSAELFAWLRGVDYIRTHDTKAFYQAVKVWWFLERGGAYACR